MFFFWVCYVDQIYFYNREIISSYECGFDSKDTSRLPFSLYFFLILLVFIVFDVELCFLLQVPYESFGFYYGNRLFFLFVVYLLVSGVLLELFSGILLWKF
uniref:NADH-ubiquinone oxidoreductase chain 3 n=1 Tax=Girardia tigrina TaxID=6162 RepID=A0A8F2E4V5_GIRTI|nr:NADH dehydrogenase subunit 3 [Girardia tigrina]